MSNKIIITGATSGIGRRMAELYSEQGNRVGVTGRRNNLLEELKQQYPEQIETECFDVTRDENIARMESLVKKLGGLDLLIINAGVGEPSKELKWELDKMMVDINVVAFIEIANWGFNYFINQNHGQLVTVSSMAANRGNSWAPAYAASKSFQSKYFEGIGIKLQKLKKNVFVTCIEPGFVDTKMAKGNKIFWLVPLNKAVRQIIKAIEKKKRKVYISRRWWLIAKLMKWSPYWLYKRFG